MAEVVLFHHAQGLTKGVAGLAAVLGADGHVVHTPDLFAGRTFDTLEQGMQHAQEIGFSELVQRGVRAVDLLATDLVYLGISLGVLPAQYLAQTRSGARGAIFLHACLPRSEFGSAWPQGLPAQIHAMDADPFFVGDGDIEAARALVGESSDVSLFLYPGNSHLFSDRSLAAYDPAAAAVLERRLLDFLAER
ncbi:dienelactone hydrolase family protein [Rhizobium sp. Root1220]|uniref:dienelactone hydrolase family protein n=1 Tax=Rhizobium sp. Root1220 TaxID=1736432 RepID=UPI0006F73F57|nr:dienelactone hydrolase family protein [Rhizobium sp. Root1220]KQV84242.1 dienelactone hydrolase [Rhizobium sp. Root1220]